MEKVAVSLKKGGRFRLEGDLKYKELNPKALLLLALAKCAGMTSMMILRKMEVRPSSLEIECSGKLSTPTVEAETVFTEIRVRYNVTCRNLQEQQKVSRALTLAHDKYCGVAAMLRKAAPVEHEFYITTTEEQGA